MLALLETECSDATEPEVDTPPAEALLPGAGPAIDDDADKGVVAPKPLQPGLTEINADRAGTATDKVTTRRAPLLPPTSGAAPAQKPPSFVPPERTGGSMVCEAELHKPEAKAAGTRRLNRNGRCDVAPIDREGATGPTASAGPTHGAPSGDRCPAAIPISNGSGDDRFTDIGATVDTEGKTAASVAATGGDGNCGASRSAAGAAATAGREDTAARDAANCMACATLSFSSAVRESFQAPPPFTAPERESQGFS